MSRPQKHVATSFLCGLSMACLCPGFGLDLDSLGAGSGAILCPGGGMFVWLVMVV